MPGSGRGSAERAFSICPAEADGAASLDLDRKRQLNVRFFRNAYVLADEIGDFGRKRYAIALDLFWNLDFRQEQDLVVVAVLDKRADGG